MREFRIGVVLADRLEQKTCAVIDLAGGLSALEQMDFLADVLDKGCIRILRGLRRPRFLIYIAKALLPDLPCIRGGYACLL